MSNFRSVLLCGLLSGFAALFLVIVIYRHLEIRLPDILAACGLIPVGALVLGAVLKITLSKTEEE